MAEVHQQLYSRPRAGGASERPEHAPSSRQTHLQAAMAQALDGELGFMGTRPGAWGLTKTLSMLIIALLIVFILPARERWPLISPTIS
jgi:uncharacterized membrane protein YtjA (UPF0391 family)